MSLSGQNATVVPVRAGRLALAQPPGYRTLVVLAPHVPVAVDLHVERGGQRVHHADPDPVQAAGDRVGLAVELPAGVQRGEHQLDRRPPLDRMQVDRDAPAVVYHPHATVGEQGDLDPGGVPGHRLVDGVVHDLLDQVVQTALAGRADVHARPLADRVEAFQDRDRRRAVGVLLLSLRSGGSHRRRVLLVLVTSVCRDVSVLQRFGAAITLSVPAGGGHACCLPGMPAGSGVRTAYPFDSTGPPNVKGRKDTPERLAESRAATSTGLPRENGLESVSRLFGCRVRPAQAGPVALPVSIPRSAAADRPEAVLPAGSDRCQHAQPANHLRADAGGDPLQ